MSQYESQKLNHPLYSKHGKRIPLSKGEGCTHKEDIMKREIAYSLYVIVLCYPLNGSAYDYERQQSHVKMINFPQVG